MVNKIIEYFKSEMNRRNVIYISLRKYQKDFIEKIIKFQKLIDISRKIKLIDVRNRTTPSYQLLIIHFYQILVILSHPSFLLYWILLYFVRKLEWSPRWRSFHVEKYQRSRIIITRKKRVQRVQSGYHSKRGNVVFFTYISPVFFFTYFDDYHLPRHACIAMKRNRGCFCTMRKINRENTLWWLVRRKGNLGQEFFDVPPHWRSEWIARVQRPPPPPVEFTDQVFRFSARKGEFLEFFHRIARTELLLMELLFYKRFFVEYCRFACGRRRFSSFLSFDRVWHFCSLEIEEEGTNPFFDSFFFFFF